MLESFVRNEKLDSPIFYQGCIVGDPKYDISLNKFLAKDSSFNRSFNIDNYDDDAFKRRNLEHLKAKELLKQMNGSQTPEKYTPKPHSKSYQRIGLNSSMKIVNPNRFNEKLREKEFKIDSQNMLADQNENRDYQDRQRLFSRDDRLKAPKSSQFHNIDRAVQMSRQSKQLLNQSDEKIRASRRTINHSIDVVDKTPINDLMRYNDQTFEGVGSKRKKLLQISNQTATGDPFLKNRLQTQAAYIQKQIKPLSIAINNR